MTARKVSSRGWMLKALSLIGLALCVFHKNGATSEPDRAGFCCSADNASVCSRRRHRVDEMKFYALYSCTPDTFSPYKYK